MQIEFVNQVYHELVTAQCNVIFDNNFAPIFYFHNGDELPLWKTVATQNMDHYGILDPHDDPPSLDYSHFLSTQMPESHPVSSDKPFPLTNSETKVVQSQPN